MKFLEYFELPLIKPERLKNGKIIQLKGKRFKRGKKNDLSEIYILLHRLLISLSPSLAHEILMNDLI